MSINISKKISINISKSLENIDPKHSVAFIDEFEENETTNFSSHFVNDAVIWSINNFLTENECDEIVYVSEKTGFKDIEFGTIFQIF
jgi:hypothetical protein